MTRQAGRPSSPATDADDDTYYLVRDGDGYEVEAYGRANAHTAAVTLYCDGHPGPIRPCPNGQEPLGTYGTIG